MSSAASPPSSSASTSSSSSSPDVLSKGKHETLLLKANISQQLNRLLTQLEDLEDLKSEFSPSEYAETKSETMAQLAEFEKFLEKSLSGDLSLIDEFGAAQLAIQSAISSAFKTPEVIRMFAEKQPQQLRDRLSALQRDLKIRHITKETFGQQTVETLMALKKMGTTLTTEEQSLLDSLSSSANMESASSGETANLNSQMEIVNQAQKQIKRANEK